MPPTPCPPPADLAGFHRGELPATAADTVAAHVEHCPACEAALQALDAGDGSLAAAFRRPADGRTGAWADGPPPLLDGVGTVVGGRYKLVEPVGEGGMGSVWMAQQTEPVRRLVAVKLIKAGMDSRQVLARFEAERQALALMDHPNIARVLDAGATTLGRPYFVMELVKGVPITDYCDAHKLTPRERLALFVPVCQAVQHAHQKGVIHRDIKPSNVLVARYDGRPVPKVIDFGVAKAAGQPLTDKTLVTGLGAVVGTPEYMAPEQAELNQLDVDTRADVYALGVLLYELLTGSTPLTRARLGKAALLEVLRLVREEEPPAPSTRLSTADALPSLAASRGTEPKRLTALMRGELDWVVMKALEKDRGRRYDSAGGFARDVERYLADEPVEAGRPTAGYRLRKFARRYRRPLLVAAAAVLLLVGAAAVSRRQAMVARDAEARAVAEAENAVAERDAKQAALGQVQREQGKTAAALVAARDELASRRAVQEFYQQTVFAAARPKGQRGGLGKDVTLRAAIDAAVPAIAGAFKDRPLVEAAVRAALAETYFHLGDTARQIEQSELAQRILVAALGPSHRDTLLASRRLAIAYRANKQTAEALRLNEEAARGSLAALGPDDPDTLLAEKNLAVAYWSVGRPADAVRVNEGLLPRVRAAFGPDHDETLGLLANLAVLYRGADRAGDAHRLSEEVLAARRRRLGPAHPDTLTSLSNLAASHLQDGRLDEAIAVGREALRLRRTVFDPDHPDVLASIYNLGVTLKQAGQTAEAVGLQQECLRLSEAKYGPNHPDTLETVRELAATRLTAGRPDAGRPLYARFVAGQRRRYAADPVKLAADLARVGALYLRFGQAADAEPLLREAVAVRDAHEPDAGTTFRTRVLLGVALADRREHAEAERLLTSGYDGLLARADKLAATDRAGLPQAADALIRLYRAPGKSDEAARWRAERAKYAAETAPPPRPVP